MCATEVKEENMEADRKKKAIQVSEWTWGTDIISATITCTLPRPDGGLRSVREDNLGKKRKEVIFTN